MIRSSNLIWRDIVINEHTDWAEQQFSQSDLGDPRRTARLVKLASTLANEPGKPLVNITQPPLIWKAPTGLSVTSTLTQMP